MLIPYDSFGEGQSGTGSSPALRHYASELAQLLHLETLERMQAALDRAMHICENAGLPVQSNFRPVYRSQGDSIQTDYHLSDLASYLVIINADADNEQVAYAQVISFFKRN
jgi:DNA-damage-inducible protein D